MKLKKTLSLALVLALTLPMISMTSTYADTTTSLKFNTSKYTVKSLTINGQTIKYRAFEKIVYVKNPIDTKYQCMNFYVPESYYSGKTIGGYTVKTAPIFLPNEVGGYMPAEPGTPEQKRMGPPMAPVGATGQSAPNAIFTALSKGYVVAAPGARGRTTQDQKGQYTGKAPAGIVDLKAAVRYLHYNDKTMPGNAERIISNGTSAGGALSSLLGATGNSKDYVPYLKALGAAEARDDVYAASCYCPITNLDHADMAYEWLFNGLNAYSTRSGDGTLTAEQIEISSKLKSMFPAYVNGLGLKSLSGTALKLEADGNGNFKDYVKSYVIESAQRALDGGKDLSGLSWLTVKNGKVTDLDFDQYVAYAKRMKATTAFDALDLSAGENELFGTTTVKAQHFTQLGMENATATSSLANPAIVKLMNPMNYIGAKGTTTAKYWRVRHGTLDRDTSLAIPVILATTLQNKGFDVDFAMPWDQTHGGDYDLDQLFTWMGKICRK